jgi:hypothetical protein
MIGYSDGQRVVWGDGAGLTATNTVWGNLASGATLALFSNLDPSQ